MYKDTDESENETLSIIDLDGIKTAKDFMQIAHSDIVRAFITENFVFVITENDMKVYDIMSGYSAATTDYVPLITESGKEFVVDDEGYVYYFHIGTNGLSASILNNIVVVAGGDFYVCDDNFKDFYFIADGDIFHNDVRLENSGIPKHMIYADNKCYCLGNTGFFVIEDDIIIVLEGSTGLNVGFIGIDERTGYGYCTKKFNSYYVCPYCEDTDLNFPNSTYYQIISYILAIMFKSKQGADVSLLNAQLEMASQTFEETLGSDAYQFPRMGNVYN